MDTSDFTVCIPLTHLYHLRQAAIHWAEINVGHPAWKSVDDAIEAAKTAEDDAYYRARAEGKTDPQ